MPLWLKKHKKGDSKSQLDSKEKDAEDLNSNTSSPPQIFRSDTLGIEPIQIPETSEPGQGGLNSSSSTPKSPSRTSRLSKLVIHGRSGSQNSLPNWTPPNESDPNAERDWEARATKLAKLRPTSMQTSQEDLADLSKLSLHDAEQTPSTSGWSPLSNVDGMTSDDALQEAIRLHEAGGIHISSGVDVDLAKATDLFKKIADQPANNDNSVLGQLLYGLALR
jgi:hypothetical protein